MLIVGNSNLARKRLYEKNSSSKLLVQDNYLHSNNRIVSSGLLPDGTQMAGANVGSSIWDEYGQGVFYNNSGHDNTIGWVGANGVQIKVPR